MRTCLIIYFMVISINFGQNKYALDCDPRLLSASLDSAFSQIGIIEKTNRNDGEVEKYLRLFGLNKGQPYCAAGQYWCFYTASLDLGLSLEIIPINKSASAFGIYLAAKKKGTKTKFLGLKHDLIIWKSRTSRQGHIERIFKSMKRGNVLTIGFNTRNKRTGKEGVFIQHRNIRHPLGRLMIKGLIGFNIDKN